MKILKDIKKQNKANKPVNMDQILGLVRGNTRVIDDNFSESNNPSVPNFNIEKTTYGWKHPTRRKVKLPSLVKDEGVNGRTSRTAVGVPKIQCQQFEILNTETGSKWGIDDD